MHCVKIHVFTPVGNLSNQTLLATPPAQPARVYTAPALKLFDVLAHFHQRARQTHSQQTLVQISGIKKLASFGRSLFSQDYKNGSICLPISHFKAYFVWMCCVPENFLFIIDSTICLDKISGKLLKVFRRLLMFLNLVIGCLEKKY